MICNLRLISRIWCMWNIYGHLVNNSCFLTKFMIKFKTQIIFILFRYFFCGCKIFFMFFSLKWLFFFVCYFISFYYYLLRFLRLFETIYIFAQVDNLLKRSKIPIIVGGTNYYIESIVWHNLVSPKPNTTGRELTNSPDIDDERFNAFEEEIKEFITNPTTSMDTMDTAQLYAYLKAIDPISANRLHPNNKRKIIRWVKVIDFSSFSLLPRIPILFYDVCRNFPSSNIIEKEKNYHVKDFSRKE